MTRPQPEDRNDAAVQAPVRSAGTDVAGQAAGQTAQPAASGEWIDSEWAAGVLVAALVLAPAAFIGLPFELGLRAQAVSLVTVLALIGIAGRGMPRLPPLLMAGLAAYAAAAVWGASVGLLSGYPLRNVASQSLSMLLLPAAAVVFARHPACRARTVAIALMVAVAGGLGLYLLAGALQAPEQRDFEIGTGMRFGPNLRLATSATLALLLGIGWWRARRVHLAWLGIGLALAVVIIGQSRGQWLATLVGLVIWLVLAFPRDRRRSRQVLLALAATVLLGAATVFGFTALTHAMDDVVAVHEAESAIDLNAPSWGIERAQPLILDQPASVNAGEAIEVRGRFAGTRGGRAILWLAGRDSNDRLRYRAWPIIRGTGSWADLRFAIRPPEDVVTWRVGITPQEGQWAAEEVELVALRCWLSSPWRMATGLPVTERLGTGGIDVQEDAPLRVARGLSARFSRLLWALREPLGDTTIAYRAAETEAVVETWRSAGWLRRLSGFGLGATFAFENPSWDAEGQRVRASEASYIHNFYVFLFFKLGLFGLVALGGLLVIAAWTVRRSRQTRAWAPAAVAAAWVAYLLWSVSSPEILDFRLAPLWGVLVAISARGETQALRE